MACWIHSDVLEQLAVISVVGDGMRTLRGISAKFFSALARANINIVAISPGLFRAFHLGGGEQ